MAGNLVIAFKADVGTTTDLIINEMDIENLKRAKGAIYAAAAMLVNHMGFGFNDLEQVYIGGDSAPILDMPNAIFIGLLPGMPREKFVFVGNAHWWGRARYYCLTRRLWTRMRLPGRSPILSCRLSRGIWMNIWRPYSSRTRI